MGDDRTIQEQCYGTCYEACNQIEAAQARIAALEAALREIYDKSEMHFSDHPAFEAIHYKADDALTPEGGGK